MPVITISINHKIGRAEAVKRIKEYAGKAANILPKSISNLKLSWNGDCCEVSFFFANIQVQCSLLVGDELVSIKSQIPLIFVPLKGQIEKVVRQHAVEILK